MFIFWIKQARRHLAVVNIGRCNSVTAAGAMIDIDANTVLESVVADAIF
jgi:hypothetical protein